MFRNPLLISLRVFSIVGCLLLPNALAFQTKDQTNDKGQTMRLKTDLFELRAVVTDAQGKIVDNLGKEDFELFENNKPQTISFFSLERVNGATASSTKDKGSIPNSSRAGHAVARTVVLFADTLNMTSADVIQLKQAFREFVDRQMTDRDLVAILSSGGSLGLLSQFTKDRHILHLAIDRLPMGLGGRGTFFTPYIAAQIVSGDEEALTVAAQIVKSEEGVRASPPGMEPDHLAKQLARGRAVEILNETQYKRRATLSALREVAERLADTAGQRLLVYYTDGFSMRGSKGEFEADDLRSVTSRAVRSGVVIYSIDTRGLYVNPVFDAGAGEVFAQGNTISLLSSYMSSSMKEDEDGMNALAKDTGGEAFFNSNDMKGALAKALDSNSVYYALGYYPSESSDKSFRRITLRIKNHRDYRVRTQRGYLPGETAKAKPASTPEERLQRAIMSPVPASEIEVSASAYFFTSDVDRARVSYEAHVDGHNLNFTQQGDQAQFELEVVTLIYDLSGKRVDAIAEVVKGNLPPQQFELAKRNGLNYSRRLDLKPGLYQFRVGVRELASGRIGATTAWGEVPDLSKARLALSSIFLQRDLNEADRSAAGAGNTMTSHTRTTQGIRAYTPGESLVYRFMVYHAPGEPQTESDLNLRLSISHDGKEVFQGSWQPLAPLIIKRESIGIDIGGQFKLTLPKGVYELTIAVKHSKSKQPLQESVPFAVEP
jgi:VWFA-related protein